jgi:hypothetical protein
MKQKLENTEGTGFVILQPTKDENLVLVGDTATPFGGKGCLLKLKTDAVLEVKLLEGSAYRVTKFKEGWSTEQLHSVKNTNDYAEIDYAGR